MNIILNCERNISHLANLPNSVILLRMCRSRSALDTSRIVCSSM
jgi:hypothetical protein